LLESQPAIAASAAASKAVTMTTVEEDSGEELCGFNARFVDDFEGINWSKLRRFEKPSRTLTGKKSWVFKHGYRVALRRTAAEVSAGQPERTYFVCRWCHNNTVSGGIVEVSTATSSAAKHLGTNKRGHRITLRGQQLPKLSGGQQTITNALKKGVEVS
jgi:hypothetical protein